MFSTSLVLRAYTIVFVCRMENALSPLPTAAKITPKDAVRRTMSSAPSDTVPLKQWCWRKWCWEPGAGSLVSGAGGGSATNHIPWLDFLSVFCNFRSANEIFGLSVAEVLVLRTALCMGLPQLLACNGRDFETEVDALQVLEPFLRKNRAAASHSSPDTPVGRMMGKQWPHVSPICPATRMRILWECVWDCAIDSLAYCRRNYLAVCGGYAAARVHRGQCGLQARLAIYGDVDVFSYTSSSSEFGRIAALPRCTVQKPAALDWVSAQELFELCERFPELGERAAEMQLLSLFLGMPVPAEVTRYGVDTCFVASGTSDDSSGSEDNFVPRPFFETVARLRRRLDPAINNGHRWELDILSNQRVHDMLAQCSDVWGDTNANDHYSQTCRSRAVYRFAAIQHNTAGRCGVVDHIVCINPKVLTAGDVVKNFDMGHVSVYLHPLQSALTSAELLSRPFWARGPEGTFFGGHDDECLMHAKWGRLTLRPRGVRFLEEDYPFLSWDALSLSSFVLVNWPRIRKYLARGWEIRHGDSEDQQFSGAFHPEVWKPSDSLPQYDSRTHVCLMAPRLSEDDPHLVSLSVFPRTLPIVWDAMASTADTVV